MQTRTYHSISASSAAVQAFGRSMSLQIQQYAARRVNRGKSLCLLSWVIVGFILGVGWLTGELLKGGGWAYDWEQKLALLDF